MIVLVAQVVSNTICRGAFYLTNLVVNMPVNIRDVDVIYWQQCFDIQATSRKVAEDGVFFS